MRKPRIIARMCWVPVPPTNFAFGNISKNTTYPITPDAIPENIWNETKFLQIKDNQPCRTCKGRL